jgi:hypothetical protein
VFREPGDHFASDRRSEAEWSLGSWETASQSSLLASKQGLGTRVIQPVLPSVPWRHTEVSNVRVTTAPKQQLSSASVLPGFLEGALGANVESLDVSCSHVAQATTPPRQPSRRGPPLARCCLLGLAVRLRHSAREVSVRSRDFLLSLFILVAELLRSSSSATLLAWLLQFWGLCGGAGRTARFRGGPRVVEALKLVLQSGCLEEERDLRAAWGCWIVTSKTGRRLTSALGRWVIIWWYSAEWRVEQLRQRAKRATGAARVTHDGEL